MASKGKERIVHELTRVRDDIRRKLLELKHGTASTQRRLETRYKPLIEPLKELARNQQVEGAPSSMSKNAVSSKDAKTEVDDDDDGAASKYHSHSTPYEDGEVSFAKLPPVISPPRSLSRSAPLPLSSPEASSKYYYFNAPDEEVTMTEPPSATSTPISTLPRPTPQRINIDAYASEHNVDSRLRDYLHFLETDVRDEADFVYGIHYDGNTWRMGTAEIGFSGKDIIVDGVKRYEGTPGLYELIFKKRPQSALYNANDLRTYRSILKHTGAHLKDEGQRVKSNKGYKYIHLISNLFPPMRKRRQAKQYGYDVHRYIPEQSVTAPTLSPSALGAIRKRTILPTTLTKEEEEEEGSSKSKRIGKGLAMSLSDRNIDYRHWDDPNELVERLRLLVASKRAGNMGHNNEIIAILEELHEAGIINDFDTVRL